MDFDFSKEYVLEDERVLLRPLTPSDDHHLRHYLQQEPGLWEYFPVGSAPVGEGGMERYIQTAAAARSNRLQYPFIVFDKKENEYAGSTRFYDIQPVHEIVSIGNTWYGSNFQGTGLNKHAKFLLLQFAFEALEAERVQFEADQVNEKSVAAMKSIGCTVEGVLRSNRTMSNRRRDTIVLRILKEEWIGHVKENLKKKL